MSKSIKNIIFDMGNVLLDYDPEVCLDYFLEKEADRAIIRRELFEGPEWEQGDLGRLTDLERFYKVRERVPERLHGALKSCAVDWTMCMRPVQATGKRRRAAVCMYYPMPVVLFTTTSRALPISRILTGS